MDHFLGLDIGGTKFASGVISSSGTVVSYASQPTIPGASGDELWSEASRLMDRALTESGLAAKNVNAVGIGSGGPMDLAKGLVSPLNIPGWRDFPLLQRIEDKYDLPAYLENDGKALTLGEAMFGAARGVENFMAMVVSTGIGGGIVLDGRLLGGRLGNAGHVGHINVEPDGNPCACGARGCLEAQASGLSIQRFYGQDPRYAEDEIKVRCGTYVGRGVASVASLLDLDLILVGGSVALGFAETFFTAAQKELTAQAGLEFARGATIRAVGLADHGPIIGAASVAMARQKGLF